MHLERFHSEGKKLASLSCSVFPCELPSTSPDSQKKWNQVRIAQGGYFLPGLHPHHECSPRFMLTLVPSERREGEETNGDHSVLRKTRLILKESDVKTI